MDIFWNCTLPLVLAIFKFSFRVACKEINRRRAHTLKIYVLQKVVITKHLLSLIRNNCCTHLFSLSLYKALPTP